MKLGHLLFTSRRNPHAEIITVVIISLAMYALITIGQVIYTCLIIFHVQLCIPSHRPFIDVKIHAIHERQSLVKLISFSDYFTSVTVG